MKKNLIIVFFTIIFCSSASADKLLKNGFINDNMNYADLQEVTDPQNTIILIYNHGQDKHDAPLKDCSWKNNLRNSVSLLGKKIKGKQIMVYNFCTNNLAGDDYTRLWKKKKFKPPYKGKPKLEKRLDANLELIDKFVKMGVPNKQIILTGHSCGGWMTMMLIARYPNKVGGGISYMPACYGKISKDFKVKKNITDEKSKLVPSDIGFQINKYMSSNFKSIIDANFTSLIEEDLDKIASGNKTLLNIMKPFYKDFSKLVISAKDKNKDNNHKYIATGIGFSKKAAEQIAMHRKKNKTYKNKNYGQITRRKSTY